MQQQMMTKQIGDYIPQPSNTGTNWEVTGQTIYNCVINTNSPAILEFGVDTEGGDRAKTNLIRKPIELLINLADGTQFYSSELEVKSKIIENGVEYSFSLNQTSIEVTWKIFFIGNKLRMDFTAKSNCYLLTNHDAIIQSDTVKNIELIIPFNPKTMGTNILSENWEEKGCVKSPLIINALDMGQLALNDTYDPQNKLNCRFIGSRAAKRIDFFVEIAGKNCDNARSIVFEPVYLINPSRHIPDQEWRNVRRGLLSLLQCTPYYPSSCGFNGSPGGIIGNNVISDPVSCNMCHNLRWVAGMGDEAIIAGINLNSIVKFTIEYWINERMNEDGSIDYVLESGNVGADANTGVLNAAGDYFNSTMDTEFVRKNNAKIKRAINYFITRDFFDDGLFISNRNGNGNNQFGDTGYDTICSGWKNALINAQAYKAFADVAKMMSAVGEQDAADQYILRAKKLRKSFNEQFYDENTGLYYWWIGRNGVKHQYIFTILQEIAVIYGIADCLENDTGIKKNGRDVMLTLWNEFEKAGYYDSKKDKYVKYINSEKGDYTGFYWGIPNNLRCVPKDYNYSDFGEFEFPYYCNGGIFPQDTTLAIEAYNKVGLKKEAGIIKENIYRRQHEGIFKNGSGFYMGVVNISGMCYSIIKWDGTPTDYEGIISRDCSFLGNTLWLDPQKKEMIYSATDQLI